MRSRITTKTGVNVNLGVLMYMPCARYQYGYFLKIHLKLIKDGGGQCGDALP